MSFRNYRDALQDCEGVHDPRLLIAKDGRLEVRYAPFDFVNRDAKLVILGITPGEQQANSAILEARRALCAGEDDNVAMFRAKSHASFSGPMRTNLIAMLDAVGMNKALSIESCASLWDVDLDMVHFASALRYPVFKDGKNYTGSSPKIVRSPFLRDQLLAHTAVELAVLSEALVLPLGPAVTEACRFLVQEGRLDDSRVIEGVPHPSGANAERISYFLGRKERGALSSKTNPEKIEAGRERARKIVLDWQQAKSA